MENCSLKLLLVILCIIITLFGLYLSIKREHKNISKGNADPMDGSGNLKDGSFSFKFAIGLVLIVIGILGAFFSIRELPECNEAKTSKTETSGEVKAVQVEQTNENDSKIVAALDFYEGRFTWQKKFGKFGLLNREGDVIIPYEYDDAEQFDYTGFAKVKKREASGRVVDYLIDTSGYRFKVAYRVEDLQDSVVALDIRDLRLDSLSDKIFSQTQLRILLAIGSDNHSKKIFTIPEDLFRLVNLQSLALISFGITSLPADIKKLKNLSSLILFNNRNLNSLPPDIHSLTKLETLDLTDNDSLSTLPHEIGNLIGLRNLYLSSNTNLSPLPSEIWNLNLQRLVISGTKMTGLSSDIGKLKNTLKVLYLDHNKNLNNLSNQIWQLTQLEDLNLNGTYINDTSLTGIINLIHLKKLNLNGTNITKLPSGFGALKNLTTLYISGNKNLNHLDTGVWNLRKVIDLGLSDNNLSTLSDGIGNLTKLEVLYLNRTKLSNLPSTIKKLTHLTTLYLDHNENLMRLPPEIRELKNLTNLYLNHNKSLTTLPYENSDTYKMTTLYLDSTPISSNEVQKLKTIFFEVRKQF